MVRFTRMEEENRRLRGHMLEHEKKEKRSMKRKKTERRANFRNLGINSNSRSDGLRKATYDGIRYIYVWMSFSVFHLASERYYNLREPGYPDSQKLVN